VHLLDRIAQQADPARVEDRAQADHARLRTLDPQLAARLERIMAGDGRDEYDGLTPQYD